MAKTPKAYARSLKIEDRKTALENLRLVDGYKIVEVINGDGGVSVIVHNAAGREVSTGATNMSSFDAAAEELRRGGFVAGCSTHEELLP